MGKVIVRGADVRKQAITIVANGGTFDDAALATGYGRDYVRQLSTQAGVYKPTRCKGRKQTAIMLLTEGETPENVAERLGYQVNSVKAVARQAGLIKARPKPEPKLPRAPRAFVRRRPNQKKFIAEHLY